ncbi:Nn.00g085840.m01.CDS01 [Neocucurbitaria sp. VM-36]
MSQLTKCTDAQEEKTTKLQSLSIEQLFSMVLSTGAKVVGLSNPIMSHTLDSIEAQQISEKSQITSAVEKAHQGHVISTHYLFFAASRTAEGIIRDSMSIARKEPTARTLKEIESEMLGTAAARDPSSHSIVHNHDTASKKLRLLLGIHASSSSTAGSGQHSGTNSPLEHGTNTPPSQYSVSPPPNYSSDHGWYPGVDSSHSGHEHCSHEQKYHYHHVIAPKPHNAYGWPSFGHN